MRPTKDPFHRPAMQTLERLHAELGGRILDNKAEGDALRLQMQQVEAVLKMLDPAYSVRGISVKRRKTNQWFKRGTLYRRALDVLRTATGPMTATEIAQSVLSAAEISDATAKDATVLGQSIQASLRNHAGNGVEQVNDGIPARWILRCS